MEKLFGSSELLLEKQLKSTAPRPTTSAPAKVKESVSYPQYDLLVLLSDIPTDAAASNLLDKMLKTLEIGDKQLFVTSIRQQSVTSLIEKHQPKCLLAMGAAAEALKVHDFSKVFSRQMGNIQALGTWGPEHLLTHNEDKKHSWETLLLLKSLLKS